jgi:hypothetical protein
MTDSLYRIEVTHELITPVSIRASSEKDAKEKVLQGEGEAGDTFPGETFVARIRLVEP